MAHNRHGFSSHVHTTASWQPQPSPRLRSEKTSPHNHSVPTIYRPSTTASRTVNGDIEFASLRSSTTTFLSAHSSPPHLDRRLHPTSVHSATADPLSSTYPQDFYSSSHSSKTPLVNDQHYRSAVVPAAESPDFQKKHHTLLSSSLHTGVLDSGTSNIPIIPNLLGLDRLDVIKGIMFRLSMRQQPQAARACGFGDRDRRVIDPPPIVQLYVEGPLSKDEAISYLRYESYVMNCSICDESGTKDASFMPEEYQHQRRLMGSLVGTPFVGQDDQGDDGCFFCFSDLSCRTPGAFRLKFTLVMIDPARAGVIRHFPVLTEIVSDVFHVYSAKEFPGMLPSSNLAKRLKEQGCIISIKKGNDRSKNARGQDELSDDDDTGEGSEGLRKRRVFRG
ncbi:RYP2-like protein [Metarhizium rileyi]|uniref:RYP2-like protein n=1 Tax=Metarhizium rileyi (strain RCEF 4871) TaxID=1649241 RepID=A0A166ZLP1_METRR|nr:RYP2-like protein [Metarhizium rileyi RCEF 4871]